MGMLQNHPAQRRERKTKAETLRRPELIHVPVLLKKGCRTCVWNSLGDHLRPLHLSKHHNYEHVIFWLTVTIVTKYHNYEHINLWLIVTIVTKFIKISNVLFLREIIILINFNNYFI